MNNNEYIKTTLCTQAVVFIILIQFFIIIEAMNEHHY